MHVEASEKVASLHEYPVLSNMRYSQLIFQQVPPACGQTVFSACRSMLNDDRIAELANKIKTVRVYSDSNHSRDSFRTSRELVHPNLDLDRVGVSCTDRHCLHSTNDAAEAAEFFGHHAGRAGRLGAD